MTHDTHTHTHARKLPSSCFRASDKLETAQCAYMFYRSAYMRNHSISFHLIDALVVPFSHILVVLSINFSTKSARTGTQLEIKRAYIIWNINSVLYILRARGECTECVLNFKYWTWPWLVFIPKLLKYADFLQLRLPRFFFIRPIFCVQHTQRRKRIQQMIQKRKTILKYPQMTCYAHLSYAFDCGMREKMSFFSLYLSHYSDCIFFFFLFSNSIVCPHVNDLRNICVHV